jgi:hypothetical protein
MLENTNIHIVINDDILLYSYFDRFISKYFLPKSRILLKKLLDIRIDITSQSNIAVNIFTFGIWGSSTKDNKKSLISFSKTSLKLIHRSLIKIMKNITKNVFFKSLSYVIR